ncbi:MAG TPA: glycosyltransferase family 2 protein [Gammaproteobacteria bacterium]|nr:glycosyltransferase family 2 protein [Gammaproteobacteria bacterium]
MSTGRLSPTHVAAAFGVAAQPAAPQIAVILPCRNEAASIAKVVRDFKAALPGATVHVCDNDSTDGSAELAASAGAVVHCERLAGKGNVVRRLFSDVEADVYVLADGDDTYDHTSAATLVHRLLEEGLDMVVGVRVSDRPEAYRTGHRLGNYVLTKIVRMVFGDRISDMLSGYRVLSRRFVKSFPALTTGFETETELTIHALELRMPIVEVPTPYRERPPDSKSKLNTIRDGWRILRTILLLVKEERPLKFFAALALLLAATSMALAWPLLVTYIETGLVPRMPTAILATGLMLVAFLSLTCGAVLDTVTRGRRELKRLYYLGIAGPAAGRSVHRASSKSP